jgi:hypothetical protein
MDAEIQAFKDKMAEKAAAKAKVMAAVGEEDWATVAEQGINGVEGKAMAEAQAIADKYVKAHPEQFAAVMDYSTTDEQVQLVTLIDLMSKSGMEEAALALTMFELARFERQEIGVATKAKVRLGNGD